MARTAAEIYADAISRGRTPEQIVCLAQAIEHRGLMELAQAEVKKVNEQSIENKAGQEIRHPCKSTDG